MKTLQELYNETLKNKELMKDLAGAVKDGRVEDFLKANSCEASAGELSAFLKERQPKTGELSDEDLDLVAGGSGSTQIVKYDRCPKCGSKEFSSWEMCREGSEFVTKIWCQNCGEPYYSI